MAHPVEDLVAYRVVVAVADELWTSVVGWTWFEKTTIGLQLMRAVDSIGANIAESRGRMHFADRRRFLIIARGSYLEAEHWLKRSEARGLLDEAPRERLAEGGRALNGMIRKLAPDPRS